MSSEKKTKKFLKNPWLIGIGTYIIADFLIRLFFDFKLLENIILFVINLIKWIGKFLVLKFSIAVWIFILSILAIPIIIILVTLLTPMKKTKGPTPYDEYTKDIFDGIVWRWIWKYSKYENKYNIEKLAVFCPECDCQLNKTSYGALMCPNCEFTKSHLSKSINDIEILIFHHIRKKHFSDL